MELTEEEELIVEGAVALLAITGGTDASAVLLGVLAASSKRNDVVHVGIERMGRLLLWLGLLAAGLADVLVSLQNVGWTKDFDGDFALPSSALVTKATLVVLHVFGLAWLRAPASVGFAAISERDATPATCARRAEAVDLLLCFGLLCVLLLAFW